MIATRPDKAFSQLTSEFRRKTGAGSLKHVPGEISMTNGNGTPPEAAPPPQLNGRAKAIKHLSFENPNAPGSLAPQKRQPGVISQITVSPNNIQKHETD